MKLNLVGTWYPCFECVIRLDLSLADSCYNNKRNNDTYIINL